MQPPSGPVESVGSLFPALGFVLGGVVTAAATPRTALAVAGGGALLLAVVFLRVAAAPARADVTSETADLALQETVPAGPDVHPTLKASASVGR